MRKTFLLLLALLLVGTLVPMQAGVGAAPPTFDLSISGHVINTSAGVMAGVNVTATNITSNAVFYATSNASGAYEIQLPAGTYNITATIMDYAPNTTYPNVRIDSTNLTGLDFTMKEILGTVTGFVTDGLAPIVGATVTLSSGGLTYNATTTIPLGQYTIENVYPGVYVARAEQVGYWANVSLTPITVQRGVTVDLSFSLAAQPAHLFGSVSSDGPLEGVTVVVSTGGVTIAQTVTDQNGNYSFSNVHEGSYTVEFSKDGYHVKDIPITISSFEEKNLPVTMDRLPVEGKKGFVGDFDLSHSLMIVCLLVAFALLIIALFIRTKAGKKPSLLAMEEEQKKDGEEEGDSAQKRQNG